MDLRPVLSEFSGLTNNEAYLNAFNQRVLLPSGDPKDPFLGNTQRLMFLPLLREVIRELPTGDAPEILDIGAGKGEIVDLCLETQAPKGTRVSIEEPNPILFEAYRARLNQSPSLTLGESWDVPVQALYAEPPSQRFDLVLSIHMIYHLTDWHDAAQDPVEHLEDMIAFAYSLLKPGGRIFLVYADQEHAMAGRAGLYVYRQRGDHHHEQNLTRLYRARNQLLAEGGIKESLAQRFPDLPAEVTAHHLESCFFGHTVPDLAAMALVGELISADNEPFDTEKLIAAAEYFMDHGDEVGLQQENATGPRKGMWRANQPQIATTIKKPVV